ncbi:aminotransferase class III-fold pyridoxal phosphate-dependent enzyme [Halosegnis rubeus]|jgi:acetylornithine/LysW-gamma-L-lysine aminotransferase|uniref:Putative [LysW]-aminoadipate semialdehyde/glutamate semialdehyde transaminase n=1 Tax=Halosegnis rubeus TaxID=2212850 RepID=A0A5N5UDT4_9EURY|nr:aspartate aminotransferase family protein [Halosegnis rubeus]KAB7516077.1 aminotransferase class III-fold pyridoxal phosphate-dependent enzyme [Halosegnis rubeus]KAB7516710.1 aminotransferase class III-fold pyridoxal phosphate-dependent enzyme [Halosegnis rubeus]KAB7520159.1 aminotransferase class III-fold pyridoxal phosphate-dependent enzyme [Halosegnis rubeus]
MSSFVFSEKPIPMESGEGAILTARDGTEYLDFGASYACTPVGHCHPDVVDAITEQAKDLLYVQASYPQAARTALYDQLADVAPSDVDNVWLCNSGTEANEAALKFARSATDRTKIIATTRGFHGRTMGALATTWKDEYKEPYEPLIGDVEFVPYGDAEAMAEAVDDETAAVILEPLQGEGGINPASTEYLQAVRVHTAQHGAALVMDEIQTGLGRTGTMWACEQHDVVPDVLTSAKGLASGLPLGATLVRDWVADGAASHGSTFSGTPVVCAAAGATLDVLEHENLPDHAAEMGQYLREQLTERVGDDVRDVRGEGLMVGIEVKRGANRLLRDLALNHQVLALPAGRTVLRLLPPLVVDEQECDAVVDAIEAVVS